MSVARKHTIAVINLKDDTPIYIAGVSQQGISTGTTVAGEPTSGEVSPRFLSMQSQNPVANFTTMHIAAALDAIGLEGLSIATLTSGLEFYLAAHAEGGTRSAGATHRKIVATEGLIVPRSLSVSHGGDATLRYETIITYDGTNAPIIATDSVSLPTAQDDDERFTLGPVTIGGVALTQIRSLEIDFGVNAVAESADGDIWPTFVSIETIEPTITLRGIDVQWFDSATTIGLSGQAATHANTAIYLRKRAEGGGFVADATAEHVKLTAAGMAWIDSPFEASGSGAAECNLTLKCSYDGTNAAIVIDTTSALP